MLLALIAFGITAKLGPIYFAAMIPIAAALFYEHRSARQLHDLAAINRAFFNANAFVSAMFLGAVCADRLLYRDPPIGRRGYKSFRRGMDLTSRSTSRHAARVARLRTRSSTRPAQFPARDFLRSVARPETAHWHRYVGGKAARFPNSSTTRNAPRALCSPPSLRRCRSHRRQFHVRIRRAQPLPRPVE